MKKSAPRDLGLILEWIKTGFCPTIQTPASVGEQIAMQSAILTQSEQLQPDPALYSNARAMACALRQFTMVPKQPCFGCNQRNDIDNLLFCLSFSEAYCGSCTATHSKKLDAFDGCMHPVCRCGGLLKLWDTWYAQVKKLDPEAY